MWKKKNQTKENGPDGGARAEVCATGRGVRALQQMRSNLDHKSGRADDSQRGWRSPAAQSKHTDLDFTGRLNTLGYLVYSRRRG